MLNVFCRTKSQLKSITTITNKMKKTLLSAAAIILAGVSANATTIVDGQPNAYGNVDSSQSTFATGNGVSLALDVTPHVYSGENVNIVPLVKTISPGVYGVALGTGGDGRAFWNYDYAFTTVLGFTYNITLFNTGTGQSASFNPLLVTDNHVVGLTSGNSESFDFSNGAIPFPGALGFNPFANDTYDVTFTATSANGAKTSDSIVIIAGTGSVPDATSTMGLMSLGLAGLGLFSRRSGLVKFRSNRIASAK